jgi:hypothetical protein
MSSYKLPLFFAKLSLVIISALGSEVAIEKYRKQTSYPLFIKPLFTENAKVIK